MAADYNPLLSFSFIYKVLFPLKKTYKLGLCMSEPITRNNCVTTATNDFPFDPQLLSK